MLMLEGHSGPVWSMAWSHEAGRIRVNSVAWSHDASQLALTSDDDTVKIWGFGDR